MQSTQSESTAPPTEIDLYDEASGSTVDDPFLSRNNLGLGNYGKQAYWQQVESFADGLFGDTAFGRLLTKRAVAETKRKLAVEGWTCEKASGGVIEFDSWDEQSKWEDHERRQAIRERGEEIWNRLDDEQKAAAVEEQAGAGTWTPPQWRMLMMRHEGSRSIGARLMDNLFGRVQEQKVSDDTSDALDGGRL
jgi:hypothetical protein